MGRRVLLPVIGLMLARAAALQAQNQTLPSVSVVRFEGGPMTELSIEDGEAIADELATHLVESRQCRVLQREWLPTQRADGPPSLDDLRKAAAAAGVEYLVVGRVTRAVAFQSARPPFGPSHIGGRTPSSASRVMVESSLIEVATGEMVKGTMASQKSAGPVARPTPDRRRVTPRPGRGRLGVAVLAVTALRSKESRFDSGLQRAIDDTAKALTSAASQLARN